MEAEVNQAGEGVEVEQDMIGEAFEEGESWKEEVVSEAEDLGRGIKMVNGATNITWHLVGVRMRDQVEAGFLEVEEGRKEVVLAAVGGVIKVMLVELVLVLVVGIDRFLLKPTKGGFGIQEKNWAREVHLGVGIYQMKSEEQLIRGGKLQQVLRARATVGVAKQFGNNSAIN